MNQADLNRAIARATGESVGQIARMGFGLLTMPTARSTGKGAEPLRRHSQSATSRGGAGREGR